MLFRRQTLTNAWVEAPLGACSEAKTVILIYVYVLGLSCA